MKEIRERVEKIIKSNEKPPKAMKTKFSNTHSQIISPANRILEDLKGSSSYSLHNSISKISVLNASNFDTSKSHKPSNKVIGNSGVQLQHCISQLSKSTDILAMKAGKCFYDFDYKSCLKIIDE